MVDLALALKAGRIEIAHVQYYGLAVIAFATPAMGNPDVLQQTAKLAILIDEARIRNHFGVMVRGTVEETLNAMLDGDADQQCGAQALRA